MAMQTPEPQLGTAAPDFDLAAVDGPRHTLASVRGPNGLLVMFICSHCPYVQALRDRLVGDMRELQNAGIGVVAICANDAARYPEDSPARLLEQAREWSFSFPYLHDATQEVARAYGAVCTPDFFGYDANLRLRYRGRLDSAAGANWSLSTVASRGIEGVGCGRMSATKGMGISPILIPSACHLWRRTLCV